MSEISNNCIAEVPKWVEAKLFEKILKEIFPKYKNIKEFNANPCLAPGEIYTTLMLRIEIEVQLNDSSIRPISFMLKVQHDNELINGMMKAHDIFDIEKSVYDEIIPEFEKLYADVGVKVKFGANCYNLPIKRCYILLENLSSRGFKNVNRLEGLDVEHTKSVLKKLAQWHAASAAYVAVKGPFPKKFIHGYFLEEGNHVVRTMFEGMGQIFLSFAKTYNNYSEYADEIHSCSRTLVDELFKAAKADPIEFNVLNHGDCWSNNIMFQYDAFGKIKETYLLDYQIPQYGTPAQDLFYLLLSSTKYEIKIKQFDYFIKYYHDNLVENLKVLNYPKRIPSLSELHGLLYKYGIWGYSTVTGVMASVLLDSTNFANLENFLGNSASSLTFRTLMYSNERYRKHAEAVLPWLKNRGAF